MVDLDERSIGIDHDVGLEQLGGDRRLDGGRRLQREEQRHARREEPDRPASMRTRHDLSPRKAWKKSEGTGRLVISVPVLQVISRLLTIAVRLGLPQPPLRPVTAARSSRACQPARLRGQCPPTMTATDRNRPTSQRPRNREFRSGRPQMGIHTRVEPRRLPPRLGCPMRRSPTTLTRAVFPARKARSSAGRN